MATVAHGHKPFDWLSLTQETGQSLLLSWDIASVRLTPTRPSSPKPKSSALLPTSGACLTDTLSMAKASPPILESKKFTLPLVLGVNDTFASWKGIGLLPSGP